MSHQPNASTQQTTPPINSGIFLMIATALALIIANSPAASIYQLLIDLKMGIHIGEFSIDKPLLLWINDGLMAVFFFVVGLELKREVMEGELSKPSDIGLPILAALGGMAAPAAIYLFINADNPVALQGWAIPAATDIAFALGVLMLLGPRVPASVKIFLTSLAIFDDIGAIVIIAVFYTAKISTSALVVALACIALLALMNRLRVSSKSLYLMVGVIMWVATLKSGVHATLAGVVLAMFIPLNIKNGHDPSPLKTLEQDLHDTVALFILPIFAFANAGLSFSGYNLSSLLHPVPLGISLGLVVGKQVGIFGICWLAVTLGWAKLPRQMTWPMLYATAALCGIGFTMSLFIGSLAFESNSGNAIFDERLGILLGSFVSGILGYFLMSKAIRHITTPNSE